jgi:hypothetical protein
MRVNSDLCVERVFWLRDPASTPAKRLLEMGWGGACSHSNSWSKKNGNRKNATKLIFLRDNKLRVYTDQGTAKDTSGTCRLECYLREVSTVDHEVANVQSCR